MPCMRKKEKGFCAKSSTEGINVNADSHNTHLENLKPMYVHCDCGRISNIFYRIWMRTLLITVQQGELGIAAVAHGGRCEDRRGG